MECQNEFCIYQKEDRCILTKISLDVNGMCLNCIYPNISKEILNEEKAKLRKQYDEE